MDVEKDVRNDEGDLGKKIAKLNKPLVNRIIGHGEEAVDQLLANPLNFRLHPDNQQQALAGAIDGIGFIRSVTVNQRTGRVVDGHLRVTLAARSGVESLPVEYVDLSEAEEAQALLSLDPIAAMAASDKAKLDELMRAVQSDDERVQAMIGEIAESELASTLDIDFDEFDGEGDGGGSRMMNGDKVRVVLGALMFDIPDPDHLIYKLTEEADEDDVREKLLSLIAMGELP